MDFIWNWPIFYEFWIVVEYDWMFAYIIFQLTMFFVVMSVFILTLILHFQFSYVFLPCVKLLKTVKIADVEKSWHSETSVLALAWFCLIFFLLSCWTYSRLKQLITNLNALCLKVRWNRGSKTLQVPNFIIHECDFRQFRVVTTYWQSSIKIGKMIWRDWVIFFSKSVRAPAKTTVKIM